MTETQPTDAALRIVVMGTGPFAVPSFQAIAQCSDQAQASDQIVAVITRPQPPVKSRSGPPPSPVADWAARHGYPVHRPASINDPDAIELVQSLHPDLLVVCDYGQILKPAALATAKLGGINLHGSLLPAYRGAAPVQRAMLSGDRETGVSVIHMTPRLDGGPIVTIARTPIRDDETAGELEDRLSTIGVDATLRAIQMLRHWDGRSTIGQIQSDTSSSKAPRLAKSEGEIDWNRTTRLIDCQVRGMQPWPIAFTMYTTSAGKPPLRIQIKSVTPLRCGRPSDVTPGQILSAADLSMSDPPPVDLPEIATGDLLVATGDGVLRIDTVQPAGKKTMTGQAFVNGYQPGAGAYFDG